MDAMMSAHADAREIDEVIRMGADMAQAEAGIEDSELADELQALVQEAEAKEKAEEERRKMERLHEQELRVPSHAPGASEEAWTDHEMDEEFRQVRTDAEKVAS